MDVASLLRRSTELAQVRSGNTFHSDSSANVVRHAVCPMLSCSVLFVRSYQRNECMHLMSGPSQVRRRRPNPFGL